VFLCQRLEEADPEIAAVAEEPSVSVSTSGVHSGSRSSTTPEASTGLSRSKSASRSRFDAAEDDADAAAVSEVISEASSALSSLLALPPAADALIGPLEPHAALVAKPLTALAPGLPATHAHAALVQAALGPLLLSQVTAAGVLVAEAERRARGGDRAAEYVKGEVLRPQMHYDPGK
jgi:hypothetical protein